MAWCMSALLITTCMPSMYLSVPARFLHSPHHKFEDEPVSHCESLSDRVPEWSYSGSAYGIRLRLSSDVRWCSPYAQILVFCSLRVAIFHRKSSALLHGLLHFATERIGGVKPRRGPFLMGLYWLLRRLHAFSLVQFCPVLLVSVGACCSHGCSHFIETFGRARG
jgi:hypothetical protein